jgi:hypothetical protein
MATTVPGSSQPFSRIVETRRTSSWAAAIPAAIFLVAAVVLIAWFAARASEYSQKYSAARNELGQQAQTVTQLQQRTSALETDMNRLRNPGRTTVILRAAAAPARGHKGTAQQAASGWGAATWGEQPDGKTWVRIEAYGLPQAGQGKLLDLWFEPTEGAPVLVAKLDPGQDGSAFAEGKDLPGLDAGKRLFISTDSEDAKQPGDVVAQADLPKLKGAEGQSPQAQPKK